MKIVWYEYVSDLLQTGTSYNHGNKQRHYEILCNEWIMTQHITHEISLTILWTYILTLVLQRALYVQVTVKTGVNTKKKNNVLCNISLQPSAVRTCNFRKRTVPMKTWWKFSADKISQCYCYTQGKRLIFFSKLYKPYSALIFVYSSKHFLKLSRVIKIVQAKQNID